MYLIERTNFGLHLTFGNVILEKEMTEWFNNIRKAVDNIPGDFLVFVDMRTIGPVPHDSQIVMEKGQKYCKDNGMLRSVVILSDSLTRMQFTRIAKKSGIYEWERYIDVSTTNEWEKKGMDWILDCVDPDVHETEQVIEHK
jgi:hypothetical protein